MTTNLNTDAAAIMKTTLGFLCALLLTSGIAPAQQESTSLRGAWQVTNVQMTGANARTVTNPQPGLYLFTGKYFSLMMVMGDHPRPIHPTLPEMPKASAQEILAVYGPYVANTGMYEVNGGALIMHPTVSKNPELMGGSVTYSFEIHGNSLTLKMVKMVMGASVPPPPLPQAIWTLTRVE
ncbi:MAG: lipocalin-like domain-containing protein [Bryobacteraceae bacterium]